MEWTTDGLRAAGFEGFVPFSAVASAPSGPGVYVVTRPADRAPVFLDASPAGRFKGKNPSYPAAKLRSNWIDDATVLYIGKADRTSGSNRGLRTRLTEYAAFGAGEPVGHAGGRAIWHLDDHAALRVCWRETVSDESAEAVETTFLAAFLRDHDDRLPFANMRRPNGMAKRRARR